MNEWAGAIATMGGAVVAAIIAMGGAVIRVSAKAGQLEQRVISLETDHGAMGRKIDELIREQRGTRDAVIRVEAILAERS